MIDILSKIKATVIHIM